MCWKLCGKRLNSGGRTTATSSRTSASVSAMRGGLARLVLGVQPEVEQRELELAHGLHAGLERAACACSFVEHLDAAAARRCSTCAEISGSTSSRQAKFSMNWLGSSTASHGTPLMPATLG